jgi:hypothetical protein
MSPLRLNGSTSGYSQLDAPAIAGDQTFTLPGTGGTLDRLNRAGNILQVVENSSSTTQSGITATTSILTASITPSSATNKIIVMGYCTLFVTPTANAYGTMFLFRGTTSGTQITRQDVGSGATASIYAAFNPFKLDSPSTTSSQTYTLAVARGSVNTASVSTDGIIYGILLMEVAA